MVLKGLCYWVQCILFNMVQCTVLVKNKRCIIQNEGFKKPCYMAECMPTFGLRFQMVHFHRAATKAILSCIYMLLYYSKALLNLHFICAATLWGRQNWTREIKWLSKLTQLNSLAPILVFFRIRLNTWPIIELWLNHSFMQNINGLFYSHFSILPKIN